MVNLSSFITFHAARTPERLALVYKDQRLTYAALLERITAAAGLLRTQGVAENDVVALLMKNSAAFLELTVAISHIGAVVLPINYRLAADEVSFILADAGATLVFADRDCAALLEPSQRAILLDEAAQSDSRRLAANPCPAPMTRRRPEDLFRLMYTSGTTDRPKGVMHTYANFYWKSTDHIIALGLTHKERLLVTGPLYHVGAFDLPGLAVLWVGGSLHVHRDFDPARVLATIAAEKITGAWLAPVMTAHLLAYPQRQNFDVSSLQWVIGGGERTPESKIRAFSAYFRSARYIDAYGLTESCSGDTLMEAGREIDKIGSVGRALAHVEIAIRDRRGEAVAPGVPGEICLRGPKITRGYWRAPEKTAGSFFGEWFRTGDIGYLDEEGFLYLTDRLKDMIISGGENIASSELERVIYELPEVREVAVVAVPDETWGECPVAVVVLEEGRSLAYDRLADYCRSKLAAFKVPKQLVVRAELPRNPSGKVLKRELRDQLTTEPPRTPTSAGKP